MKHALDRPAPCQMPAEEAAIAEAPETVLDARASIQGNALRTGDLGIAIHTQRRVQDEPRTFTQIQYMRGVAALLVVYFHTKVYLNNVGWHFDRSFGYGGVDIFFVISGFIMTMTNLGRPQSPTRFLRNRVLRIYPPYWIATTAALLLVLAAPSETTKHGVDASFVVFSYLLLPIENFAHTSGGIPLLKIGWTLICEMWFYIIVAVTLALGLRDAAPRFLLQAALILALILYRALIDPRLHVPVLAEPILTEFLLGCIVGLVVGAHKLRAGKAVLTVAAVAFAILFLRGGGHGDAWLRVLFFGVPAMGLIAVVALGERDFGPVIRSTTLLLIGDMSFSIYLTHPFTLTGVRVLTEKLHLAGRSAALDAFIVCGSVVAAALVGYGFFAACERPLLRWSRGLKSLRTRERAVD